MNTVPSPDTQLDTTLVDDPTESSSTARELDPLTVFDRCDAKDCSAQAYVRARLGSGLELVFCGHHGRELVPALVGRGATVRDDSHLLAAEGAR